MSAMAHQRPPTPHSNEVHEHGLQHFVDHNANTPSQIYEAGNYFPSGRADSAYDSPALNSSYGNQPFNSQYPELEDGGLGINFQGFDQPDSAYCPAQGSSLRENTPQTPKSTSTELSRRTRSGRTLPLSNSPHVLKRDTSRSRITKSPKTKSPKQKALAAKTPKINAPLSELTKDMDILVRDMEAWVNRPAFVRQQEVEKRNGYVTRPMNSFMLYRSAYAERTKQWGLQNNHQVVSSISGESWPLEPQEVREQYNEYARIERINHAKAHPNYKFSPSKTGPASRSKKTAEYSEEEDDDDDSDGVPGDEDYEWKPRSERARSSAPAKRQAREASPFDSPYNSTGSPFMNQYHPQSQLQHFQLNNPHFSGAIMAQSSWTQPPDIHQHQTDFYTSPRQTPYYGQPSFHFSPQEHPTASPYFTNLISSIGLPSGHYTGHHADLLQLHSHTSTPIQMPVERCQEQQVDPMLLQLDGGSGFEYGYGGLGVGGWGEDRHQFEQLWEEMER